MLGKNPTEFLENGSRMLHFKNWKSSVSGLDDVDFFKMIPSINNISCYEKNYNDFIYIL